MIFLSAILGAIAGLCCSGIIALIHYQINTPSAHIGYVASLFVLLTVVYFLLSVYSQYLLETISQEELCRLRIRFSQRILSLPLREIEKIGAPNLFASLTNDLDKIVTALKRLPTLFINGSMIIGAGCYMAWLSFPLFMLNVFLLPLGIFFYIYPLKRLNNFWVDIRKGWDNLCRHFHSLTHGTKELLIHQKRRHSFLSYCIKSTCENLKAKEVRGKTIQNLFFRWGDILYLIGLGIVIFIIAPQLELDKEALTGYVMAGLFIVAPLGSIFNWGPNFGEASVAIMTLEKLGFDVYKDTAEYSTNANHAFKKSGKETRPYLQLTNVMCRYHTGNGGTEFILGPVTLSIHKGQTTYIAGGNGSGKTTLLKLLCGLYIPEAGEICWRGVKVTEENRETYRQLFSVLFSDYYLFETLFGLEDFNLAKKAQDFLAQLELDHRVSISNGKLSTTDLSQGQRKRLALMVAYLEDRPVYIFDEWAADQDPVFKRFFYQTFLPAMKANRKTIVAITHDEAWYHLADRIVKLEDGKIISDSMNSERRIVA